MFACRVIQDISMDILTFASCLIVFLLHVLYFDVICILTLRQIALQLSGYLKICDIALYLFDVLLYTGIYV